ncbi:polysaccharide deacetylase family protein [Paenibacillus sp. MY03]|uniref:polysaccharide deacetylase family protein n=1 Tax=Paenibacillus sp. MY03 TaxID=302980 RepID=UPI000B3CB817|nr:polysaccharide deacetylase family protein [Paenibacillus sp. MY03]OUS77819.1 polysaccharide deacetylase family protein [Paenibacillus sp. MY03]
MENLFLWGFYVMTFYAFLPGLISRTFGFRVFKRGRTEREIALTFDDGPDPQYTPQLLDLLARFDAKATFFVVGSHAEQHPELLRRMEAEGHIIGIHNYVHKSNWVMRPRTVKRQIERTNDIIEQATGKRAIYYRPPWGIVNVFDYSNLGYLHIILWSALFGDWRKRLGAERLKKRMMKKLRPGEVLLLHDCGRTLGADQDAPRNMLIALESYLEEAKARGFQFVGIDRMIKLTDVQRSRHRSIVKRFAISLWLMWEQAFHAVFRLKKVGESEIPAFHYRVTKYTGEPVTFANGKGVNKGDDIAEIHFDNKLLSSIAATSKSPLATGLRLIREVENALPALANQLAEDAAAQSIKAVYGVTMIHRGADRLGFEVFQLPEGWFKRSTQVYLRLLMKVLTNTKQYKAGRIKAAKTEMVTPRMLFMPLERVQAYATVSMGKLHEEAGRLSEAVERSIVSAADDAASLGT